MPGAFYIFSFVISDCIQFSLQGLFLLALYKNTWNCKRLALFTLVNAVVSGIPQFFFPAYPPMANLVLCFTALLLSIKYIFKLTAVKSILGAFLLVVSNTGLEYFVVALLKISFLDAFHVLNWIQSPAHFLLMRSIANFLCFLLLIVVHYFTMPLVVKEDLGRKKVLGVLINTLLLLLFIVPNTLFFQNSMLYLPTEVIVFNVLAVLVLVALSLYNTLRSQELEAKKQEVEFQKLYNKTVSDLNDTLRGFKHDFNNVLQVMSGYLDLENYDGLKKFFSQLQAEARTVNNITPLNSYVKDHPALYGLLLSKISYAEILDVQFEIDVATPITIGTVKTYDFYKVLGILIDNALEAASESSKKHAQLILYYTDSTKTFTLYIQNTFTAPVEIENIFENGFTTKPNHSGFGLWEVQKILKKYKNFYLFTNIKEDLFIQKTEIYL